MSVLKSYQDLEAWKKSIALAEMVYGISAQFPPAERFGLTNQIRRAAVSVPANIAEGAERNTTKEFLQFLGTASGSLAEMETFLILAGNLGMAAKERISPLREQAAEVGRMLSGLKRSLRSKI
ncbi:MAG: four helix bundle protein [Phycisphaerae bacterium]|nr:four helix bundle protein [Phycisphaerae bacterium]